MDAYEAEVRGAVKVTQDMLAKLEGLPVRRSGTQKMRLTPEQEKTARHFFAHRKERGWAMDDAAKLIGIHSNTLRRIGREWGVF